MGFRVLRADEQVWRATNPLGVVDANLTGQLGVDAMTVRLWRLAPGQAIPRHRHRFQTELYLLLEGTGKIRVDQTLVSVEPMSAVVVDPSEVRQVFNDTNSDVLWLIAGTPPETFPLGADEHADEHDRLYPDGVAAPPPELERSADPGSP
jgi:quercetin dioxygenase-like cupin family protein